MLKPKVFTWSGCIWIQGLLPFLWTDVSGLIHLLLTPCQSHRLLISEKNMKRWPECFHVARGLEPNLRCRKAVPPHGLIERHYGVLHWTTLLSPGEKGEQQETLAIITTLFVIPDKTWQKSAKQWWPLRPQKQSVIHNRTECCTHTTRQRDSFPSKSQKVGPAT